MDDSELEPLESVVNLTADYLVTPVPEALRDSLSPAHVTLHGAFRNPLKLDGADPWLLYHDGWYYLSATNAIDIRMRRARRIGDLSKADDVVVWKDATPTRNRDIWAPEFHLLNGGHGPRWYLYYTACDGVEPNHRMFVAESEGLDPLGPYHFKAQLLTDPDDRYYAIDGTVIETSDGGLTAIWCGRPSAAGQGLYITAMENPWTLSGRRAYLEADGFGCEGVREGPAALIRGGRVFLVYSACSADTPEYKLGMMFAKASDDLSDPKSWNQHRDPVFQRNDFGRVYGPGHNMFLRSPDGSEDWIVYHAKHTIEITYSDRSARAQRFYWNPDGSPNFGAPLSLDTDITAPSGEA